MSFPNKEDRVNCWGHRDEYWKCLDDGKSESDCKEFRKQYEKFCPAQWVKHFDRKREYLKFKEQIENEGGNRSTDVSGPFTNKSELTVQTTSQRRPFSMRGRNYD